MGMKIQPPITQVEAEHREIMSALWYPQFCQQMRAEDLGSTNYNGCSGVGRGSSVAEFFTL